MQTETRWYVYVLWSESHQRHYVGISTNPEKRLKAHNSGKGAKATRGKGPWRIKALSYAGPNRSRAQWWEFYVRQLRKSERAEWLESNKYKESEQ